MQPMIYILPYAKELKDAGVPEQQAQIHAEKLAVMIENNLATKQELKDLEYRLLLKIGGMLATAIGILAYIIKLH